MGTKFRALKDRLAGELDIVPAASLGDRINDALADIYDENDWGFLFTESYIRTPELISGTAEVIKFSNTIIVSQAVADAINNVNEFDVDLFQKQLKVTNSKEVDRGFIYSITNWDSPSRTLEISPRYQDVDNLAANIQILQVHYLPPFYTPPYEQGVDPVPDPILDFKRFEYVISPQSNRRLILHTSQSEITRYDPDRNTVGDPRYVIPHKANSLGEQVYELYPAPRHARLLRVIYLRKGSPLTRPNDEVHDIISKDLVITKAKMKSYEWAMVNQEKLELKNVGKFQNAIALCSNEYHRLLEKAMKKDEELYPKAYIGNFAEIPYYDDYIYNELPMGETLLLNF